MLFRSSRTGNQGWQRAGEGQEGISAASLTGVKGKLYLACSPLSLFEPFPNLFLDSGKLRASADLGTTSVGLCSISPLPFLCSLFSLSSFQAILSPYLFCCFTLFHPYLFSLPSALFHQLIWLFVIIYVFTCYYFNCSSANRPELNSHCTV